LKILGIIPARYGSTRFPGKPLVEIKGKSMIQRVVEQASAAQALCDVVVATDDERIVEHVENFGGKVVLTSADHPSGTDRCWEAYTKWGGQADAVLNIQGDEPFVHPSQIDTLCALIAKPGAQVATLIKEITDSETLFDHNKVKAVVNESSGRALYFSREALPHLRGISRENWVSEHTFFKHLGLYAYRTEVLAELVKLEVSPLEKAESLEQLRWLENGFAILTGVTEIETPAVDTPEDLARILAEMP
jgi:3-deoxy-manno-octulosonate cytidylyltransferase (CMP-KDO synthetase)